MTETAPPLDRNTALALDRTRLAHERTLLAWVRTSTSLISFGFSIYKFFQYMEDTNQRPSEGLLGPRGFALVMITTGVIVLVAATIEHRQSMVMLRREYRVVPRSLATVLAGFISLLGLAGVLAVLFRL